MYLLWPSRQRFGTIGNNIDQQDRNHRGHDKCRHQPDPDALPVRFEFSYFSHGRLLRGNHRSFFCIGWKKKPLFYYTCCGFHRNYKKNEKGRNMQGWILTFRTFVSDLQIRDNWLSDRKSK